MNKKLTSLALAAAITGVAGTAQAVNVSTNGEGEVLLYPFYTVEGGQDTYFSVTNTSTNEVKAVKVRFKEGMNSQEVLDFNLYLSPNDMWTAAISEDPNGPGAIITTSDSSCTVPSIPEGGVKFRNSLYASEGVEDSDETLYGANLFSGSAPSGYNTAARTREGYVELIEMGVVEPSQTSYTKEDGSTSNLAAAATHSGGVPDNCGALEASFQSGRWASDVNDGVTEPTGGLYGTGTIIDVENATAAAYSATPLANFSVASLHAQPGTSDPNLDDAAPAVATVIDNESVSAITAPMSSGIDAVSAALMYSSINNDYVLAPGLNAGTDWVVTFPTKATYALTLGGGVADTAARAPFTSLWDPVATRACEEIGLTYFDREEQGQQPDGLDFSPAPPEDEFALCQEVNVVTFNNSDVLEASDRLRQNLDVDFNNGWLNMSFTEGTGHTLVDDQGVNTFEGLPAIGFSITQYENGAMEGLLRNYGSLIDHKSQRTISQ